MTRPAEDPVTDGETTDRQFGQRLARRWGATAQSDRRRSAIRISARKMRVFAVSGGRARLGQLTVPRATQQAVSATVASTEDQPIAPPTGAPEALQIWRDREQAALEAELAEQQAHEEAVERASRRRALRTATRQLPATEARTPGATAAGISPREIKVARPADVAAIGKLPAQPKLNANMHTAAVVRPVTAPGQAGPARAATPQVETQSNRVGRSDAGDDDSEDDTRATDAEVKTAQPAADLRPPAAPKPVTAQPWRSAQAQTVSATLQQSALNATAAQPLAPDDDLGVAHLFNTDPAEADPVAEAVQPAQTAPARTPPVSASPTTTPVAAPARQEQQPADDSDDDDLAGAFANLFEADPDEPHAELPQQPQAEVPQQPQADVPQQQSSFEPPTPQQHQSKPTPLVRRPGSMWGADADPANPDLDDDVVEDDNDDLGSAFANLFDESPDEAASEMMQVDQPQADQPQSDQPHADQPHPDQDVFDEPETETTPEPQAQQSTRQKQVQQPKPTPVVRRPGSMWDAYADPADPDLDENVVEDEDDDLAPAFANLFDENPDEPETELTSADEPQADEPETDSTPEPQPQRPTQQKQMQQPKRTPLMRRAGSMWDADADPANPDFDDDVVENDDDDLGSAFSDLFDENPDEPQPELPEQPQAQQPQPPMPPRTVPAWDEQDAAADDDTADDPTAAFAQLFDEDSAPLAPTVQQPTSTEVQRSLAASSAEEAAADEQAGLGLDGLFDEADDTPPGPPGPHGPPAQPPAPVQPPPAWRATPPSTRSTGVLQQRQLALPTAAAATALLDPPLNQPKRAVALTLAHARSTSIAMPEMLTSKRAAGWMTTTRALNTSLAAPHLIQPATMPQTGGTTGGAFLRDLETPVIDEPDAAAPDVGIGENDPPAVPDIVRQSSAPPRMSVRELVAYFDRGAQPPDASSPFLPTTAATTAAAAATTAAAAATTAATTAAALTPPTPAAGLLANLPRALTVAPPRISVQPDQPSLADPEAIGSAASPLPSATRPGSTPTPGGASADAAFKALATKIVGPPKPAGARPALPTPTGGPLVSAQQSTTPRVIRRRRGDNVAQPPEPPPAAFPELNQGTQTERLDALVDRVVERIEQRVIDELERRGRRHSRGVF